MPQSYVGLGMWVNSVSCCLPERSNGGDNEGGRKRNVLSARSGLSSRPLLICWGRLLTGSPGKNDWKL